jgi:hypothetical protein
VQPCDPGHAGPTHRNLLSPHGAKFECLSPRGRWWRVTGGGAEVDARLRHRRYVERCISIDGDGGAPQLRLRFGVGDFLRII